MHQHEVRFFCILDSRERPGDRVTAIDSAGDDGRALAEDQFGPVGAVGRDRHDDAVDDARMQQSVDGTFDQRASTELKESLGNTGGQPFTRPRGRDHCDRAGQPRS